MTAGFEHFDGSHREPFAAALVLLCIEEDPSFRDLFASIIRQQARIPATEALLDWGREADLDTGQKERRRSDRWLNFAQGRAHSRTRTRVFGRVHVQRSATG